MSSSNQENQPNAALDWNWYSRNLVSDAFNLVQADAKEGKEGKPKAKAKEEKKAKVEIKDRFWIWVPRKWPAFKTKSGALWMVKEY